jgi:adenylate cyclase
MALSYSASTVYMYLVEERQRLHLRRAWRQRVSSEVLSVILSNPGLTQVMGKRIDATCLFSDLRGFTDMCHALEPEQVVQRLNEYLTEMTRIIQTHGGVIHKFIGDGIMAVFGDPVAHTDHAARAVRAAIEMQREMAKLRERAEAEGSQPLHMRIGIHTGPLVAGDIGSQQFLEYTVIGATVSIASRLEGLNKELGTDLLIGKATREGLGNEFAVTPLGFAEVRGVPEPVEVFSVAPGPSQEDSATLAEAAPATATTQAGEAP